MNNYFKLYFCFFFLGLFLSDKPCFSEDTRLKPLDVDSIHLYVTLRAVAKADSGFATRHFKRAEDTGRFERKFNIDLEKNRPVFEYAAGYIEINNGQKRRINWRYRGLLDQHWQHGFPYRSVKIEFLDQEPDLSFSILNLNQIETDPFLHDMVGHEIYHLYGCITPRMKLVKFYVNGQYAGFKVLVENIDDEFLKNQNLPLGNIYRENTQAEVGAKAISGINYYKYWWKKHSLKLQGNWEDWINFNHLLAFGRQEVGEYLLDKDYYLRWLALGLFMPIYHMNIHNLYLYHNFENQKWYSIPWDMSIEFYGQIANEYIADARDVLLLSPNKIYTSVLLNPYNYHQRNELAWGLLNDDSFFLELKKKADKVYQAYIEEIKYCRQYLKEYKESPFSQLNLEEIIALKEQLPVLIEARRVELKNILLALPKAECTFDDKKIVIKGMSLTGFKIKKNGWSLAGYENLTLVSDRNKESIFLINFNNTLGRSVAPLEPKPFSIELESSAKDKFENKPQIAALFSQFYSELPLASEVKKDSVNKLGTFTPAKGFIRFWSRLVDSFKGKDVFSKLNKRKYVKIYLENIFLLSDRIQKRDYLAKGKVIRWSGEKILHRTTVIPYNSTLILEPGTVLRLAKGVSLIVEGDFISKGTKEKKVLITSVNNNLVSPEYWGSICFINSLSQNSSMAYTIVEYGSEAKMQGVYSTGALSVRHVPFTVENCEFRFNQGDDAANFKYSVVTIENSNFHHNRFDGIDFDFSKAKVKQSHFYLNGNDGVDCGTSIVEIEGSIFSGQEDKAISVGEESDAKIRDNTFQKNNIAVAVKDSSIALIERNNFTNNQYAVNAYIKKTKYKKPQYILGQNQFSNNTHNFYDKKLQ